MSFRIFISSVQKEFAKERRWLADYIRKDAILGRFFEVFLFEEVPAQERDAAGLYLNEVAASDIYLGIIGNTYGNTNAKGVSATEQEYNEAGKRHRERICFVLKTDKPRESKQERFVAKVNSEIVRKSFSTYDELRTAVYAALANFLVSREYINVLPFDASKNSGIVLSDLSVAKIRRFVKTAREIRNFKIPAGASPDHVLMALDLMDDAGRIVNSAELLFGKKPQRFFISSEVKCMQFFADKVSKPMADYQVYRGDVFELVDQATHFVMTHIRNWVGTRDTGNTAQIPTKFELPQDAVKEAIVNAICHRDYTSNASVQVMLFSDRLEVWSPGPLPRGMTVAMLAKPHRSIPVNPLLANAMFLMGYVERAGTGTEDIIDKCKDWGLSAPVWEDDGDFKVVLYRRGISNDAEKLPGRCRENAEKVPCKCPVNAEKVFKAIQEHPKSSNKDLCVILGLSDRAVRNQIKILKDLNLIVRVGSDKSGYWILSMPDDD
ncbi:DUF4062 domain-containing protein [Fibrobacter sp.]|uniref:DUF4062 domain-containing protein n=1 Tax=Fibrobacter sp. TaxID=35828 RepID=UPI00388FEF5F